MLTEKKTKEIFVKTKALLQGHFILSSGLRSEQYLQCAKLLMHPKQSELICKSLAQKIKKVFKKIDLVVAPAMGGVIVGYEGPLMFSGISSLSLFSSPSFDLCD